MKFDTIALVGLGALGIYLLTKQRNAGGDSSGDALGSAFTPIAAGTVTPAGNTITQPITSTQQGVDYINTRIFGRQQFYSLPNPRSTIGSVAILAPRAGGGYTQVGASNVTLHDNPKYKPSVMKPVQNSAPWNKYY